ncbi:chaperone protein TorD [Oceanisphaera marina]|uniref:Chaperone protein TorD n=1 Tax=Oceanisphaera marina TaxID=2017550 RepID=A0ABQ1IDC4_9GAMM|nr:molecular chaperone TorD family protein [Oceanisphaera marina]GGB34044.1 chaperone protein TorD [Oceanisphaera marina]
MQDFTVTSQRRAELYHWFTALFSAPLVEDDINEFGGYDMHAFLSSLATLDPLREATEAFRVQADQVLRLKQPQAELSGQYQQLFGEPSLLDTSALAAPDEESLFLMSILLHQHGTQLQDDDPLNACNQLEMMATLALAAAAANDEQQCIALLDQQRELANQLLLNWLPAFVAACQQQDSLGFYAAAAQLLLAMFSMDIHYLNNVAQ